MPTTSVAHIIRRRRRRRSERLLKQQRSQWWTSGSLLLLGGLVLAPLALVFGVAGWLYGRAAGLLPTPAETIYRAPIIGETRLYDRSGATLLYSVSDPLGETRTWIDLETLPPEVLEATLMMEDPDHLEQDSFDFAALVGNLWAYVLGQALPSDNSLTGRLVRNAFLPLSERSDLDDVLRELVLVNETKRRYTPRAVLEWYLNTADYGNDAYGIDAAARIYLGKPAADLTLDEAALLAAIPPAPRFNPFDDPQAARGRQADLLRNLLIANQVSQADYDVAVSRYTPIAPTTLQAPLFAPEFSLYAREQAEDILDSLGLDGARLVSRGGLSITTTLDLDLYEQAGCLLQAHLADLAAQSRPATCAATRYLEFPVGGDASAPPDSGALLLLDVQTGAILALAGDALNAVHPPGATLFPFVYLEGLRSGTYTPASMVLDIPQPFPGAADGLIYTPANPDGQYRGPLNLRDALAAGLLAPAVSVADSARISRVLISAHILGLNSLDENAYDLSLLERGGAVSVLDMAYAYAVLAANGYQIGVDVEPIARNYRARDPVAIQSIADAEGKLLWEWDSTRQALSRTNILGESFSYLLTDMLADSTRRTATLGFAAPMLEIGRPAAVMPALTSDLRASWVMGYTPQLLAAVQVGRANDTAMSLSGWGLDGAAPIWQALMRYAHERDSLAVAGWQRPADIVDYRVCERSGLLPNPAVDCPARTELFLRQVIPTAQDTYYQTVIINSQTRQLATAYTPTGLQLKEVYFVPPEAARDWWEANGLPLPPTEYDSLSRPEVLKAVQLFAPESFAYVGGAVDVRGTIDLADGQSLASFQLSYGQGLNPTEWFSIGDEQSAFTPGTSLGRWDTTTLDGVYTLQLTATFADDTRDTDLVQVTVDNVPPTLTLQAGEPGQIFRYPNDALIPIVANAGDNLALERVEFYRNGELLGIDRDWPYGFEYSITGSGSEQFSATVFDQVGNSASGEITVEIVR